MRALLAGLLALISVGSAVAEPIPADVLETIRASCMKNHGRQPWGPPYCMCIATEFGKNISLQGLATLEGQATEKIRQGMTPQQAGASISEFQTIERTCQRASAQRP